MAETAGPQNETNWQGFRLPEIKFRPLFMQKETDSHSVQPESTASNSAVVVNDADRVPTVGKNQNEGPVTGSRRNASSSESEERKPGPIARLRQWWKRRSEARNARRELQPTIDAATRRPLTVTQEYYNAFSRSFTESHGRDGAKPEADGKFAEADRLAVSLSDDREYQRILADTRKAAIGKKSPMEVAEANGDVKLSPAEEARVQAAAYAEFYKKYPQAARAYEEFGIQFGDADASTSERKIKVNEDPFVISTETRANSATTQADKNAVWDDFVRRNPHKAELYAKHGHLQLARALQRAKPQREAQNAERQKPVDFVAQARTEREQAVSSAETAERSKIARLAALQAESRSADFSIEKRNELKALRLELKAQLASAQELYDTLMDEKNEKPLTPEELALVKKYEALMKKKENPPARNGRDRDASGQGGVREGSDRPASPRETRTRDRDGDRDGQGQGAGEKRTERDNTRQTQNEAEIQRQRESLKQIAANTPKETRDGLFKFVESFAEFYRSDPNFRQSVDSVLTKAGYTFEALRHVTRDGTKTNGLDFNLLAALLVSDNRIAGILNERFLEAQNATQQT